MPPPSYRQTPSRRGNAPVPISQYFVALFLIAVVAIVAWQGSQQEARARSRLLEPNPASESTDSR